MDRKVKYCTYLSRNVQHFTHSTEIHVVGALVVFAYGETECVLSSLVINVNVGRRANHHARHGDGDKRREDNKACLPHLDSRRLDAEQNNNQIRRRLPPSLT